MLQVKVPEGLDLDHVIGEILPEKEEEETNPDTGENYSMSAKEWEEIRQIGGVEEEPNVSSVTNHFFVFFTFAD